MREMPLSSSIARRCAAIAPLGARRMVQRFGLIVLLILRLRQDLVVRFGNEGERQWVRFAPGQPRQSQEAAARSRMRSRPLPVRLNIPRFVRGPPPGALEREARRMAKPVKWQRVRVRISGSFRGSTRGRLGSFGAGKSGKERLRERHLPFGVAGRAWELRRRSARTLTARSNVRIRPRCMILWAIRCARRRLRGWVESCAQSELRWRGLKTWRCLEWESMGECLGGFGKKRNWGRFGEMGFSDAVPSAEAGRMIPATRASGNRGGSVTQSEKPRLVFGIGRRGKEGSGGGEGKGMSGRFPSASAHGDDPRAPSPRRTGGGGRQCKRTEPRGDRPRLNRAVFLVRSVGQSGMSQAVRMRRRIAFRVGAERLERRF